MNRTITTNEFLSVFILSKLFTLITQQNSGGVNRSFYDDIFMTALSGLFLLIFAYILYFMTRDSYDLITLMHFNFAPFKSFNYLLLLVYMLYLAASSAVQFLQFCTEAIYTKPDFFPLAILLVVLVCYSLLTGFSPLSKCGVIIMSLFLLFTLYLTLVLLPNIQLQNTYTPVTMTAGEIFKDSLFSVTQNFELFLLLIFVKDTKKTKKAYVSWVKYAVLLMLLLTVLLHLSLGAMLSGQQYPYYTLAIVSSSVSAFRRLDAVFMVLWVFVSFVRVSFITLCAKEALLALLDKNQNEKSTNWLSISLSVVLFLFIALLRFNPNFMQYSEAVNLLFFVYFLVVLCVAVVLQKSRKRVQAE